MELFIQPKTITKVAYARVSDNPTDWTKDAMEAFYNQFPMFSNSTVSINWKQRDDIKGYALGTIDIQEGTGMSIPIVIRNRELYPFDVAFVNGSVMPLTNATLNMYIQSKGAFLKAVPKETGDIVSSLFNPSFSQTINPNYVSEGVVKMSSFIEKLANKISPDVKTEFLDKLKGDLELVEGFRQNNSAGVILKIASLPTSTTTVETFYNDVKSHIDRDIHLLYKEGNEWHGIFGNSRIADPVDIPLPEPVAQNMPLIKTAAVPGIPTFTVKPVAQYPVLNNDRRTIQILEDHDYVEQLDKLATVNATFVDEKPVANETGLYKIGEAVTSPFSITRIWTERGKTTVEGFNGLYKVAYVRMKGIDTPYEENGITYIPDTATFIKLNNQLTPEQLTKKAVIADSWIMKTANNRYHAHGHAFDNVFGPKTDIRTHEAVWGAVQCGASEEEASKIANLKEGERIVFEHPLRTPISLHKIAELMQNEHAESIKRMQEIARDFIKEASVITDIPTVDAALSLNFVSKDNVMEFVDALPQFEDMLFRLARLLLLARVGTDVISEGVLRKLMLGMIEVVELLRGVQSMARGK